MKVRVLGCSGAIAKDCRTTAFLVDDDVLIDAGTGVGDLSLAEMRQIRHVFLSHVHLDHIASLPMMLDSISCERAAPLHVYGLPGTLDALRRHVFNDVIWPDFTRIPNANSPMLRLVEIAQGQVVPIGHKTIEALPAIHTVPCVGYAVAAGGPHWVFSGDTTGPNPAFWQRINQIDVAMLVIETAFARQDAELARISQHHSPQTLADELDHIAHTKRFPIYITHTKPAQTQQIMAEIEQFDQIRPQVNEVQHDIRWLSAGQELTIEGKN